MKRTFPRSAKFLTSAARRVMWEISTPSRESRFVTTSANVSSPVTPSMQAGSAEPRGYIEHDAGVGARIGSREIRGHVKRNVPLFAHDFHHWETNCQNIVLQIMLLPFQITHHTSLYVCDVLCCSMLYWLHVSTSCCICKCILNRKCAI